MAAGGSQAVFVATSVEPAGQAIAASAAAASPASSPVVVVGPSSPEVVAPSPPCAAPSLDEASALSSPAAAPSLPVGAGPTKPFPLGSLQDTNVHIAAPLESAPIRPITPTLTPRARIDQDPEQVAVPPSTEAQLAALPQTEAQAQVTSPPQLVGIARQPWTTGGQSVCLQPGCPLQSAAMVPSGQLVSVDGVQASAALHARYKQNWSLEQVAPLQPASAVSEEPVSSASHPSATNPSQTAPAKASGTRAALKKRPRMRRTVASLFARVIYARPVQPVGDVASETVESWAAAFVRATSLEGKLAPPPRPTVWTPDEANVPLRIDGPGRPAALEVVTRAEKAPRRGALQSPLRRGHLLHTFVHHELQAAELMAWALLAFPETPRAFRQGLLGILDDELRHMHLYIEHMETLGVTFGERPVRDWFWERVPRAMTPVHFVAVMGIGFEGGNLDHTARFADQFRAVGDDEGARRIERVGEEEISHVRFALHWFTRWTGADDFSSWRAHLPDPLSPVVMRGPSMATAARKRAGFSDEFVTALHDWTFVP
jgi:uncharacterized ferritin-like protein (DUF455 family)